MPAYTPHGRKPDRDESARRRGGLPAPFFPDARLAAWAIIAGYPDLARHQPREEWRRYEDFADTPAPRPSLLRRLIARVLSPRGGAAVAEASAASPAGMGEPAEPSYIGMADPALRGSGNDPGGTAGSPSRAAA